MAEREWREASDMRSSRGGLALVLVAAAVVRYWGLGSGIPYAVHIDEPEIVERAFTMMKRGTLNPHFFDYGSLQIYVQLCVSIVRFIVGAVSGAWTSLDQATIASFYLWGRALTAAIGVTTVFVVYRIGFRWGARHALLAAALLAVMPLHVRYSHYVVVDTPVTLLVALTMLLSLAAHERPAVRAFALAGMAAGLAAAVKYIGGIALIMPVVACWMTPAARPSRLACVGAAIGAAAAAFFLTAPFTLLDLPGFLNRFASLAAEYRTTEPAESGATVYLHHLREQFGWPGALLIGGGVVMGLTRAVRGPGRIPWTLALVFAIPYFGLIANQKFADARYLLPIVPMLCVMAAAAVISGVSLLRRYQFPRGVRTALIAGLALALLAPPAIASIRFDRTISQTSTVDLAYHWIAANVQTSSTIALECGDLRLPDEFNSERVLQLRFRTYEQYVEDGVDYLVASSRCYGRYFATPRAFRHEYAQYMTLFSQADEAVRFVPGPNQPGPELRIFKVRR